MSDTSHPGDDCRILAKSSLTLSAGFPLSKINIENTGNQNHPDLKVREILVTCIFNFDFFFKAGNQPIMQKW